ncbi:MAG TPA: hypothetical protein VIT20_04790 [Propionibacteriaceae bacterium]
MLTSKKAARLVLAVGIAGAGLAFPVSASLAHADAGGNDDLQFCRSISDSYLGNIIGPCTSFFRSHDNNAAATTAYFCKTVFVPEGYFATVGECVSSGGL